MHNCQQIILRLWEEDFSEPYGFLRRSGRNRYRVGSSKRKSQQSSPRYYRTKSGTMKLRRNKKSR